MKTSALHRSNPKLLVCPEEHRRQQELFRADARPEMICFRGQTLAIARHFFEISSQMGRLPSLLGREFFRARVSHHAIPSFEEQAVFARDVELCLARLTDAHAEMITFIGLYDFSPEEIAGMLHYSRTWVSLRAAEAVDSLSEIFLRAGILRADRPDRRQCQVGDRSVPSDVAALVGRKPCSPVPAEDHSSGEREMSAQLCAV